MSASEHNVAMKPTRRTTLEIAGILAVSAVTAAYIMAFGHDGIFYFSDLPQSLLNDVGSLLSWIFLPGILAAVMLFDSVHDPSYVSYLAGVAAELAILWAVFRCRTIWPAVRKSMQVRTPRNNR